MKIFATICLAIIFLAIQYFNAYLWFRTKDMGGTSKDNAQIGASLFTLFNVWIIILFVGNVLAHWIVEVNP